MIGGHLAAETEGVQGLPEFLEPRELNRENQWSQRRTIFEASSPATAIAIGHRTFA
jgi:hypothetical protein